MAIDDVSVEENGGFLPGIILLTQGYYHYWGTHLNAMKRLYILSLCVCVCVCFLPIHSVKQQFYTTLSRKSLRTCCKTT